MKTALPKGLTEMTFSDEKGYKKMAQCDWDSTSTRVLKRFRLLSTRGLMKLGKPVESDLLAHKGANIKLL